MDNQRSKTASSRKDREPDAPPIALVPHGSSEMLLNILVEMQKQQQQQITLLQQVLAAQQQQIELQQQQKQQARASNYFLELKEAQAPTFAGSTDPLEAEKWITEMEKFCQALCIPKDEWVNVTIPFLIADAEAWFISIRPAYESGGRRIDWAQFQDIFYFNYFPVTFRIQKENEFFNLKQSSMTVNQYSLMFNQLGRFAQAFMALERNKVARFKEGLNMDLRECMGIAQAATYQEVLEQALQAERLLTERNQIRGSKRPRPWNEQDEETETAANKKATSANKKAIQEDLDDSEISAHNSSLPAASEEERADDENETRLAGEQKKQIETLHKRIIQLEKDLDQKQSLQLDIEHLQGQLLKEAAKLQKMLTEKEAELEHEKKQQEALQKRIIQLEKDLEQKQSLQLDFEHLQGQLNITENTNIEFLKKAEKLQEMLKEKEAELEHEKKQQEAFHKRIIQLEKDLEQKQSLQLDFEHLQGQLNITENTNIEFLKKAEKLQKMLKEKEAELKHEKKQQKALHKRTIKLEKDFARKQSLELTERFRGQLNVMRESTMIDNDYFEFLNKDGLSKNIKEKQEQLQNVCSLWEEDPEDPKWNRLKVYFVNGKPEGFMIIERDDRIPELLNYAEGRRAPLKEGVGGILLWKRRSNRLAQIASSRNS